MLQPVDAVKDFLPYILIALFAGAARNDGPWWSNLAIVIVPILIGVWAWATTTYRVTDEQLMLRRGIISRKTLTARLDRVRSVDVTASPLQRLLGVASVKIGTGSETPFSLDGLAAAEATALRADLLPAGIEYGTNLFPWGGFDDIAADGERVSPAQWVVRTRAERSPVRRHDGMRSGGDDDGLRL